MTQHSTTATTQNTNHNINLPPLPPNHYTLLIINMQHDFCEPNNAFKRTNHNITPCTELINRLTNIAINTHTTNVQIITTLTMRNTITHRQLHPTHHPKHHKNTTATTLNAPNYAHGT